MFGLTSNLKFPKIVFPKRLALFKRKNETMTTTKEKTEKRETCAVPAPVGSCQQISVATDCCDEGICEKAIRERAYSLWEQAGYPSSDGVDFWLQAEQQLKDE